MEIETKSKTHKAGSKKEVKSDEPSKKSKDDGFKEVSKKMQKL